MMAWPGTLQIPIWPQSVEFPLQGGDVDPANQ
jgi:hypothetical protein